MLPRLMVNNLGDRVRSPEKVVISKNKVYHFSRVTCNAASNQHELILLLVVPRNLLSYFTVPTLKKVWKARRFGLILNFGP